MSKITEAIAYGNPQAGMTILRKYNCPPALNVQDLIVKLDKIGNQWTDSHVDFAGAHPEADFFRDFYSLQNKEYHNCDGDTKCEGCSSKTSSADGTGGSLDSFVTENKNALIIGVSIIVAAIIFKK